MMKLDDKAKIKMCDEILKIIAQFDEKDDMFEDEEEAEMEDLFSEKSMPPKLKVTLIKKA